MEAAGDAAAAAAAAAFGPSRRGMREVGVGAHDKTPSSENELIGPEITVS